MPMRPKSTRIRAPVVTIQSSSLGRRGSRSGFLGSNSSNHVFLGHTTALAGAGNGGDVDAVFFSQLARSRSSNRISR